MHLIIIYNINDSFIFHTNKIYKYNMFSIFDEQITTMVSNLLVVILQNKLEVMWRYTILKLHYLI